MMPENQKKTPCSKLTKRNPDSKPNSDTTPASDGQIQRPEMAASGREIEISELTFRQQAVLPRIAPAKSLEVSAPTMASRHAIWQLTVRHSRESGNPRVVGVNVG